MNSFQKRGRTEVFCETAERGSTNVIIVACQLCGEMKVLAGAPDADGLARVSWICPCCGAGQIVQIPISLDARGTSLRGICGGLSVITEEGYVSAKA